MSWCRKHNDSAEWCGCDNSMIAARNRARRIRDDIAQLQSELERAHTFEELAGVVRRLLVGMERWSA